MQRLVAILFALVVLACRPAPTQEEPTTTTPTSTTTPTEPSEMGPTGLLDEAAFKQLHEMRTDQAPPPRGIEIDLAGTKAYLSLPENAKAPLPAIVVIHEWWGLNDHVRHWTDRLAADGYAALAVDLFGGKVATTPDEAMALVKGVEEAKAREVLAAAHRFLKADPRVNASRRGVIGWCFGGGWSLQHALVEADLDAAVIYYGRIVTDEKQLAKIKAPLLGVFANRDKSIPPESVEAFAKALEKAGKPIELHRYDAEHGFANPSGARYDQASAADAWEHVRAFLAKNLKGA